MDAGYSRDCRVIVRGKWRKRDVRNVLRRFACIMVEVVTLRVLETVDCWTLCCVWDDVFIFIFEFIVGTLSGQEKDKIVKSKIILFIIPIYEF